MNKLYPADFTAPEDAIRLLGRYRQDYPLMARDCLKIRDRIGNLTPFIFNPIQRLMHKQAELQKAETGQVRAICLKYRRAGASTYILGRGYHATTLNHGVSTAIMAHLSSSTNALYRIVNRFQENNPIAPQLKTSNVRGLEFADMDSRYAIYSSETEDAGRGDEIRFLHISEGGTIDNLASVMSGIGNCVSDVPNTEVWIEGTAKNSFGEFYSMCMDALADAGQYRLIFVPWFMDPDAKKATPEGFEVNNEREHEAFLSESEMMEYHGLTLEQVYWRRTKMGNSRNIIQFAREYPSSISEAFNAVDDSQFIAPPDIQRARSKVITPYGAVIIGVDPASMGGDRFTIACRQGRKILWVRHRVKIKFNEGLEWVRQVIEEEKPERVNIDAGGGGNGDAISSALRDDPKYSNIIRAVNFGSTSQHKLAQPHKPGPRDRKAEMAGRVKDALQSEEGLDIPDDNAIAQDLAAWKVEWINTEGDWRLVSKNKIKQKSTDLADAIGLTFADRYVEPKRPDRAEKKDLDGWMQKEDGIPPSNLSWMA